MNPNHRLSFIVILSLAAALLLLPQGSIWAQAVAATVNAGSSPEAVAVNTVTHKIYVANFLSSNVTIIDAATNSTTTVPTIPNGRPIAVAVNQVTNKIYVASLGSLTVGGSTSGVTVIDGATNSTTAVIDPHGSWPRALAVNSVTNKIYVANFISSNVTVIDGEDDSTTTVTDPNSSGLGVYAIAVDETTNKIYAVNNSIDRAGSINPGSITVIDGVHNTTTTITDPDAITPVAVAVNPVTNKIYVVNTGGYPGSNHGNITVIDGATNSTTTITDPNTLAPQAVAVNLSTNKIYVANFNDSALSQNGGVTVIDGATGSTSNVRDPSAIAPSAVAVDQETNKIFVANYGLNPSTFGPISPGSVTVIDGSTNSFINLVDTNAVNPTAVSTDSATGGAYVANVYSNNVTVIDDGTSSPVFSLSVTNAGNGSGTVVSSPPGLNCPATCSASFPSGTLVSLTAAPSTGSTLAGWKGACSGTGGCSVVMNSAASVTATFNLSSAPDFSLVAGSLNLTVPHGGQNTDAITIAVQNGLASAIQLTCTVAGPPPMPTCTLNPPSVTPGSNPATSTLTISTAAASAMLPPTGRPQLARFLYATWSTLLLGLVAVAGLSNRRLPHCALGGCLVLLLLGLVACGGGSSSHSTTTNQQPENYVVTIVGSSGSIQHTVQITVTAQ
jgi:YVTN family beta-propeller protein